MSVAAVDSNNAIAAFSQQNDQVEIAAPGVSVKSTVPRGSGSEASVVTGNLGIDGQAMGDSQMARPLELVDAVSETDDLCRSWWRCLSDRRGEFPSLTRSLLVRAGRQRSSDLQQC